MSLGCSPSPVSSQRISGPEQAQKDPGFGAPTIRPLLNKEPMSGFGPLRSVLEAISAVYASREVSPSPPIWDPDLTDRSLGIRHC